MRVIDLQPEHHNSYFSCLEEWSEEMREAGETACAGISYFSGTNTSVSS